MKKIAIVVQRCHQSVIGGSESLAWQYARLLRDRYSVEVITTTAVDPVRWKNELPAGIENRDGVTIRRFNVDIGRTPDRNSYWDLLHERLLKEYDDDDCTFTLTIIDEKRLFELLQQEGLLDVENRHKISVYKIGDCVIDWS